MAADTAASADMGRPPTPVGTFGAIATKRLPSGKWKAQTRVRDYDGRSRQIERTAATKTAAANALKEAIAERDPLPDYVNTSPMTTVTELGESWIESLHEEGRVRAQTIDRYRTSLRSIDRALGDYRLRELSAARCERFYRSLTAGSSKEAAKVLRMMLDVAVRHDAIKVNPARQAKPRSRPQRRDVEVIAPEAIIDLRHRIGLWLAGEIDNDGKPRKKTRYGQSPRPELLDILDLYLATGVRTSELLAARWLDVNLDATPVELTVSGTLVHITGQGLVRQDAPKTESGFRTLLLPDFGAEILRRRFEERRCGIIFPSDSDTFLHPSNVNRVWRAARTAAGYPTVELRAIRRTVATAIDAAVGVQAAAEQLGHSGTTVTHKHYIARTAHRAPDLTETLQKFASTAAVGS